MRKERKYLCIGCKFAPTFTGGTSRIYCNLLGEEIEAAPHTVGMKYEDCPHRCQTPVPVSLESTGERLVRLARIARVAAAVHSMPQQSGVEA